MSQNFEDADFSGDAFNIRLLYDFLFLEGLHGDFLVSGNMDGEADFAESALTDALAWMRGTLPTLYCPSMNSVVPTVLMAQIYANL